MTPFDSHFRFSATNVIISCRINKKLQKINVFITLSVTKVGGKQKKNVKSFAVSKKKPNFARNIPYCLVLNPHMRGGYIRVH